MAYLPFERSRQPNANWVALFCTLARTSGPFCQLSPRSRRRDWQSSTACRSPSGTRSSSRTRIRSPCKTWPEGSSWSSHRGRRLDPFVRLCMKNFNIVLKSYCNFWVRFRRYGLFKAFFLLWPNKNWYQNHLTIRFTKMIHKLNNQQCQITKTDKKWT